MKNKLKTILITLVTLCGFSFSLNPVLTVYAAPSNTDNTDICSLKNDPNVHVSQAALDAAGCGNNNATIKDVVVNILNIVIGLSGFVAAVFIIIGGYNYMTSTGDSTKIEKAKKTILYAVIGLIICGLAIAIVNFTAARINESQNAQQTSQQQ